MRNKIILDGIQIRSLKIAKELSKALDIIDENCGIKNMEIELKNVFICGWFDITELDETEMDCLLRDLILGQEQNDEH